MGTCDIDQIIKLIELCRFKNKWDSLSFFDNTLREIMRMDYLLVIRRRIIEENRKLRYA